MDITNILKFREEVECVKKMEKKFRKSISAIRSRYPNISKKELYISNSDFLNTEIKFDDQERMLIDLTTIFDYPNKLLLIEEYDDIIKAIL